MCFCLFNIKNTTDNVIQIEVLNQRPDHLSTTMPLLNMNVKQCEYKRSF